MVFYFEPRSLFLLDEVSFFDSGLMHKWYNTYCPFHTIKHKHSITPGTTIGSIGSIGMSYGENNIFNWVQNALVFAK